MSSQVMMQQLAGGMLVTIQIFVFTLLFSLPLGLFIAFGRMSKNPLLRGISKIYISIMRGTPLMLQLLVVYFGPYYIFRINITSSYRAYAVIIAFAINYAAYFAEIYRGGIESVTNEVITRVKDTSLAFSIAYVEMFTTAKAIAASQKSMVPFIAAGIFYYVFNFAVAAVMEFWEKKLSYYR